MYFFASLGFTYETSSPPGEFDDCATVNVAVLMSDGIGVVAGMQHKFSLFAYAGDQQASSTYIISALQFKNGTLGVDVNIYPVNPSK